MLNLKNSMGQISEPERINNMPDVSELIERLKARAEEYNIPVEISKDTIHSGGTFTGKDYPCIVLKHPNPPQRYFDQVWVINGNMINFYFFGISKANTKVNKYNAKKNGGLFDQLSAAISGSAEMELQEEHLWHRDVYGLFENMLER